jgi:hypothetical protein
MSPLSVTNVSLGVPAIHSALCNARRSTKSGLASAFGYILDFSVMISDTVEVINKASARAYADNN